MYKQNLAGTAGKSIIAHTLVKNEENYVWFSIMSVINYVDKILVWDTGSTDKTVEIIKEIKKRFPEKIDFREVGEVDVNEFTSVRQKMLDETEADWLMILDGDDVWWDDPIKKTVGLLMSTGDKYDSLVHRYINPIGDIFHRLDASAHKYKIDGKTGSLGIRFINRCISGLNVFGPHGQQGFFDKNGTLIQNLGVSRRLHIDDFSYMHLTNLPRSANVTGFVPKRKMKYKYELGHSFPLNFYYPEVFFRPRPAIVPSPWKKKRPSVCFACTG